MLRSKSTWAILVLSIALITSIGLNVYGIYWVKSWNTFSNINQFQGDYFHASRYKEISDDLDNGDIEGASKLAKVMFENQKNFLESIIDSDIWNEREKHAAKVLLYRVETDLEKEG